jgi:molybdenum cofactor cytidylyltransferase
MMIWAIILAAGESKRMGRPKMLLPWGEQTIIETVIDAATQAMVDGIVVVVGANAEKVAEAINGRPVELSVNPHFREGMLSSIQWGLNSIPAAARAALVMLGDQPLIASSTIDMVIKAYRQGNHGIVLPVYRGKRGHPMLLDMKYKDEVAQLDGNIGLRELTYHNVEDVLEVELDDSGILSDVDTREEYQEMIKQRRVK